MWEKLKNDFREQIWNNPQMIQVRQKFSELDTTTQSYILIGSFSAFVLFLLVSFFALWGRSIGMKNEIAAMDENIRYVQSSAVKITELQEQAAQQTQDPLLEEFDPEAPLGELLSAAGQKSQIAKSNVQVTEGDNGTRADVKLNHISLTQLVRVLYLIEQSGAPTVVDKLTVDAKDDKQGYLWATMTVRKLGGR